MKTRTSLILTLCLGLLVGCDNHKETLQEALPVKLSMNRSNWNIKVDLEYKITYLRFGSSNQSYAISGEKIYTMTNNSHQDITFNANFTRHSNCENGEWSGINYTPRNKLQDKFVVVKKGRSVDIKTPFSLVGEGIDPLVEAITNNKTNNLNWSESFVVLPFKGDENARSILGTLYTEKTVWDISKVKIITATEH
ncbi:MAG: hypothetical protein HRT88_01305 [Lentisphaeraceae bacterium]|nr:hypothetical protein [Lentisphaeraceae bacterium]